MGYVLSLLLTPPSLSPPSLSSLYSRMNAGSGTIQGTARSPHGLGDCEWECVRGVRVRSQHYQPHSITAHHTTYSHGRWFCRYCSLSIFPLYLSLSLETLPPSPLTDFMIVGVIFYYLFSFIFAGLLQSFIICPVGKQSHFSSLFLLLLLLSSSFLSLFFFYSLLFLYFVINLFSCFRCG